MITLTLTLPEAFAFATLLGTGAAAVIDCLAIVLRKAVRR